MASVTSLDSDMRRMRLDRYTPQAASEIRSWIEETLNERLPSGDLLDALKDGVVLCKLANLILPPPGIKYKASSMPFTQRENISHFLTACERDPLNLPAHDRFLTVDLFDNKDPAQVIQCISAFSRAANAVNPSKVPTVIGPKRQASPTRNSPATRSALSESTDYNRTRGASNASQGSSSTADGRSGATFKSPTAVSSWSTKSDELTSAPAWNIHQYGYMGGASQGNQGITFGARRQITSADVEVPSLAEKEKRRKEAEAEAERRRAEGEEIERRRRAEIEEAERRERLAEEQRWEAESKKAREKERQQVEEEKRQWEEEERRWKEDEERRRTEQEVLPRPHLRGQYLSQYHSEQRRFSSEEADSQNQRIQELERELEAAKERERHYELERQQSTRVDQNLEPTAANKSYRRPRSVSPEKAAVGRSSAELSDGGTAGQLYQNDLSSRPGQTLQHDTTSVSVGNHRPLSGTVANLPSQTSPRSAPTAKDTPLAAPFGQPQPAPPPGASAEPPSAAAITLAGNESPPASGSRPLPQPGAFTRPQAAPSPFNRTERFLAQNPAPQVSGPRSHFSAEMGMTSSRELADEDARRIASQTKTKATGWAGKSLLEREMERERERQREWEEAQLSRGKLAGPR